MKVFNFIIAEPSETYVFSSNKNLDQLKLDFVGEIQAMSWHHFREFISKDAMIEALNKGFYEIKKDEKSIKFFLVESEADYCSMI